MSVSQSIIYCNTKRTSDWLQESLEDRDFTVKCIHSNMKDRSEILESFRKGDIRVLIATDIIARGIDVQQLSLVINFDLPIQKETYIHRIGRSGRYGRKGVAINLVGQRDQRSLSEIQEHYKVTIDDLPQNLSEIFNV